MAAVSVVPAILDFLSDEVRRCDMQHHVAQYRVLTWSLGTLKAVWPMQRWLCLLDCGLCRTSFFSWSSTHFHPWSRKYRIGIMISTFAAGRHQFPHIKFLKATKIKPFSSFATTRNILLIEDPTRKLFEVLLLQLFSNNILFIEDPTRKFHVYNYFQTIALKWEFLSEQGWVIKIFANRKIVNIFLRRFVESNIDSGEKTQ